MLDATKIVNGSFCKLHHNGRWLTNVNEANVVVNIEKKAIKRSGTRWDGHKTLGLSGSGSFKGFKVNNTLLSAVGIVGSDSKEPYFTALTLEVNDPESKDAKTFITVNNVQFDNIPLLGFQAGTEVTEEWNSTFSTWSRR